MEVLSFLPALLLLLCSPCVSSAGVGAAAAVGATLSVKDVLLDIYGVVSSEATTRQLNRIEGFMTLVRNDVSYLTHLVANTPFSFVTIGETAYRAMVRQESNWCQNHQVDVRQAVVSFRSMTRRPNLLLCRGSETDPSYYDRALKCQRIYTVTFGYLLASLRYSSENCPDHDSSYIRDIMSDTIKQNIIALYPWKQQSELADVNGRSLNLEVGRSKSVKIVLGHSSLRSQIPGHLTSTTFFPYRVDIRTFEPTTWGLHVRGERLVELQTDAYKLTAGNVPSLNGGYFAVANGVGDITWEIVPTTNHGNNFYLRLKKGCPGSSFCNACIRLLLPDVFISIFRPATTGVATALTDSAECTPFIFEA